MGPQPNTFAQMAVAVCQPECLQIASRRNQEGSQSVQPMGHTPRTDSSALPITAELVINDKCLFGREDVDKCFRPCLPGFEVVRA
jgi:hypothetical protein